MSVSGFHRSDLAETRFETRIPLFACCFCGPRVGLRVSCVSPGVSGCVRIRVSCVRDRVSCAGFCCVVCRTFEGLLWPRCDVTPDSGMRSQRPPATGAMCGGVRGADSWKICGPDAGPRICLFQAPGPFRVEGPSRTRSCVSSQVKAGFGLDLRVRSSEGPDVTPPR